MHNQKTINMTKYEQKMKQQWLGKMQQQLTLNGATVLPIITFILYFSIDI
jgi:fumarate reductase subunit C